jgi:hypothetical protein
MESLLRQSSFPNAPSLARKRILFGFMQVRGTMHLYADEWDYPEEQ